MLLLLLKHCIKHEVIFTKIRVDIRDVFTGERMQFPDGGLMRRVRFDNTSSVQYETHTGAHSPEYMVILQNDPREFYYEFQFTEATTFPKRVHFTGKGIER